MDTNKNSNLSNEQKHILHEGGTEAPYSGEYLHTTDKGTYSCVACGAQLFSSDAKFKSTVPGLAGWPSFDQAIPGAIEYRPDNSHGMHRTEVVCAKCGGHLGHVFDDDSETETGKHYCINSTCLSLNKEE